MHSFDGQFDRARRHGKTDSGYRRNHFGRTRIAGSPGQFDLRPLGRQIDAGLYARQLLKRPLDTRST